MKSGQWNPNILLIRKQKRIQCFLSSPLLRRTPCRKGQKGFCKMQNKEQTVPGCECCEAHEQEQRESSPAKGRVAQRHAPMPVPPPWQVATAFLFMSRGIIQKPVSAIYQDTLCAVCLCYLFLILQYLELLQEWFLTSKPARYCSGLGFTTGISGSPMLFQGNKVIQTLN